MEVLKVVDPAEKAQTMNVLLETFREEGLVMQEPVIEIPLMPQVVVEVHNTEVAETNSINIGLCSIKNMGKTELEG